MANLVPFYPVMQMLVSFRLEKVLLKKKFSESYILGNFYCLKSLYHLTPDTQTSTKRIQHLRNFLQAS